MNCYIYNRESKLEIYSKAIYQALKELRYNVIITDNIVKESNNLYIIIGGQYIIDIPKRYIILQTVPTSHLTLINKVESYWIDKDYIKLLSNAISIWDISKENIKVWNNYYNFTNTEYLAFGYESCITELVNKLIDTNNISSQIGTIKDTNKSIIVIGEDRADKWLRSLPKTQTNGYNITIRSPNQPFNLIAAIKSINCPVLLIADYEKTYVDVALCHALRYNGIPCIVEQSRDCEINNKLQYLGCEIVPWIRLVKYFKNTIDKLQPSNNIIKSHRKQLLCSCFRNINCKILETTNINIRKKKEKVKLQLYNRNAIHDVNYDLLEDGGISLKLGDIPDSELPIVTVCTPTANRRILFSLAIRNFMNFIYPKDKLKWNILDNGESSIKDIIPRDKQITYNYHNVLDEKLSVSKMRNILVETSDTEIILFMDDDDYYPPESIIARTKALLKYKKNGVECVGCRDVASYDIKQGLCAICSNGDNYLTESSLAFTKSFYNQRNFRTTDLASEYRYFLEYRQDSTRSIPFQFVTIALTHGQNTTGGVRDLGIYSKWRPSENWEDTKNSIVNILDEETQDFLNLLKKLVCS